RPFLVTRSGNDAVNYADGVEFLFQAMRNEEGAEGLGFKPHGPAGAFGIFDLGQDGLCSSEILLPFEADLAVDAVGLAQVPVGSTVMFFFVEMRHGTRIHYGFYKSRKNQYIFIFIDGLGKKMGFPE